MLDMNLQVAMLSDTCTENGNGTMISLVAVKVRTLVYVQTQRSTIPPTQQNPNKRPPQKIFSVGYKQYGTCIGTVKLHVILYMYR